MKVLISILIGLLVVGCGEVENGAYKHRPKQTDTNESTPNTKTNKVNNTTAKSVKELTLEDKVVGGYEFSPTSKIVFLGNGVLELYQNDEIAQSGKWSIVEEEIHILNQDGEVEVIRIEPNGDLTNIAKIKNGIRTEESLDEQQTIKRIK